jgi:hypothetical protein
VVATLSLMAERPGMSHGDVLRSVRRWLGRSGEIPDDDVADLMLAVQDIRSRDQVWSAMTRADAPDHFELWRQAMQCAPDELMAPVGGLAAFAAWLSGRGVLASHAAERVLAVQPNYSMAQLILGLCEQSVNPSVWSGFPPPEPGFPD